MDKTIHFIWPYDAAGSYFLDSSAEFTTTAHFQPLGVLQLMSVTPEKYKIRFTDEFFGLADPGADDADIIALSFSTQSAMRARRLGEEYQRRGKMVVSGGVHPSLCPEECGEFSDIVAIGEAEETWPRILEDIEAKAFAETYKADSYPVLETLDLPARRLSGIERYSKFNTIQATRGCPFNCDFCVVRGLFGPKIRKTPIGKVMEQIREIKRLRPGDERVFLLFSDENITFSREYAIELFKEMEKENVRWVAQGNYKNFVNDDELLHHAKKAGCFLFLIGFESINPTVVDKYRKSKNQLSDIKRAIKNLHGNGIAVVGSYIFGYDEDTTQTFKDTLEFAREAEIDLLLPQILTPFPGTRLAKRFEEENRVVSKDWSKYDLGEVVFEPKNMSPSELYNAYVETFREFYTVGQIAKRAKAFSGHMTRARKSFDANLVATMVGLNMIYMKKSYSMHYQA